MRASVTALTMVGCLAISVPSGMDSCGIAPPVPIFATSQRPADLKQFLAGKVGVLQRSYHQRYLIGGFRILSGIPLTETESRSLFAVPPYTGVPPEGTPYQDFWTTVRASVPQLGPAAQVTSYKTVVASGLLYSFPNCHEDAFFHAVNTLWELNTAWGDEDPKTLDWVRAQDQVFANCSGKDPVIPDPPKANADPLFAAYRRYQIAAALFYSGQYRKDPAESRFAAVYLILRAPGLRPALLDAQYETVDFAEARNVATDAGGHRFGCWFAGWVRGMKLPAPGSAAFLTADRDAGEAESEKILEAEPWEATYLARQTLDWAGKHPDDPRVPEALHRAVMASYYRCTDDNTGKYSKQAFDLLHRQYPKSAWTAQTPYWYK